MGSNTSKTHSATAAAPTTTTSAMDLSLSKPAILADGIGNNLLDPRSPDVNRTPIVLNSRLSMRPTVQPTPLTPVNLRKSLLNYSAKELKLLDPRSPSQFIPRTPLNMSFDAEHMDASNQQFSLEYSGDIEEASCRNFNERLANITFDDVVRDKENKVKSNESKLERIEDVSMTNTIDGMDDVMEQQPDDEVETNGNQTPNDSMNQPNENGIHMDDENISPVIAAANSIIKRNTASAASSTPISTSTSQLKSMLLKNHNRKIANKAEIFTENIEMTTPTKRLDKINEVDDKPRTPFGCLLNRRSKSVENLSQQSFGLKENGRAIGLNDENATPKKQKTTPMLKHINRSGGNIRRKNSIFVD